VGPTLIRAASRKRGLLSHQRRPGAKSAKKSLFRWSPSRWTPHGPEPSAEITVGYPATRSNKASTVDPVVGKETVEGRYLRPRIHSGASRRNQLGKSAGGMHRLL